MVENRKRVSWYKAHVRPSDVTATPKRNPTGVKIF